MARKAQVLNVGDRFGKLEITGAATRVGTRCAYPVRCDCGQERVVLLNKLQSGVMSCGCEQGARNSASKNLKVGDRFGSLEIIGQVFRKNSRPHYPVRCDCGAELDMDGKRMRTGNATGCGNCKYEYHGLTKSRIYGIYNNMIARCHRPNEGRIYQDYGGRGIQVCPEWRESFVAFNDWAMENGYTDELTIERIDVDGNYCPENCAWISLEDQARNKRTTVWVTAWGKTKTLAEWTSQPDCIVNYYAAYGRIANGWPPEVALTQPVG